MRCSHVLSNEGGLVMFLPRRQFMKASARTIVALAIADKALALTALQPVIEVGNPLGEYPDRSWERVYHDQYRYDSSFTYVCTPTDMHACRVRAVGVLGPGRRVHGEGADQGRRTVLGRGWRAAPARAGVPAGDDRVHERRRHAHLQVPPRHGAVGLDRQDRVWAHVNNAGSVGRLYPQGDDGPGDQ